ncbi:hypothetical protein BDV98DRAFT_567830 [Pterulicium gracile]|uniref:Uncharacterized protein n=1 Tax=Pterulicium gracile TaxID=1884261 RepID=A0A5C3QID4_9AGAR|nr:hypothetical protein BDV98DRAFT_567830 [Pterula gracilis]
MDARTSQTIPPCDTLPSSPSSETPAHTPRTTTSDQDASAYNHALSYDDPSAYSAYTQEQASADSQDAIHYPSSYSQDSMNVLDSDSFEALAREFRHLSIVPRFPASELSPPSSRNPSASSSLIGLGITSFDSPISTSGFLFRSAGRRSSASHTPSRSWDDSDQDTSTELSENILDELLLTFTRREEGSVLRDVDAINSNSLSGLAEPRDRVGIRMGSGDSIDRDLQGYGGDVEDDIVLIGKGRCSGSGPRPKRNPSTKSRRRVSVGAVRRQHSGKRSTTASDMV